jgi:hypothetical protein
MNIKDKEAFADFVCQHDQGILQAGDESELDMAERVWQAACEYKDKDILEWKEAARSEAQMLNEELERSKILIEALEMISEICYYHDYGDHRAVATRAIEKYRGEV